jgi:hypothetical protein
MRASKLIPLGAAILLAGGAAQPDGPSGSRDAHG